MKKLLKNIHEKTPIPEDLDIRINQAIYRGTHSRKALPYKKSLISIAASFAIFILLINTNSAFAESMRDIPILNEICRVFTFNEYDTKDSKKVMNVKIPNISITGNTDLENRINYKIRKTMQDAIDEVELKAQEFYDAFVDTGGKPEEFRPIEVTINYEIKSSDENHVSFIITRFETQASAYQENYYYNIDLINGREITLKDLLGPNFKEIVFQQVKRQIENLDDERKFFLFDDVNISDLITTNRNFYINADNKIVVVFDKYEIAAGAAGMFEFIIE